jgi:uncharacterized protein YjiS (DUF1127 family)
MKILSRARNWMKSRQTAQELANLSNETLADIGLTRFDIDNVARGLRTIPLIAYTLSVRYGVPRGAVFVLVEQKTTLRRQLGRGKWTP